jgi:hypothetical protein
MPEYSIRITPSVDQSSWSTRLDSIWTKFLPKVLLATQEGGAGGVKDHIHLYLDCEATDGQVRYAIQKHFEVSGGQYTVKDPNAGTGTTSKCLAYICKGESGNRPRVLRSIGVPEAQVATWHQAYHDVAAQVAAGTYVKKTSVYESLYAFIGDRQSLTGEQIVDLCMEWYCSVNRRVHWVSFRDAVRKIAASQDGDVAKSLRDRLLEELSLL